MQFSWETTLDNAEAQLTIYIESSSMKATNDTKQQIIQTGALLFAQKGFSAVGLAEILKAAGVPKGSFYHYFESKEVFGQEVLVDYFADYALRLQHLFNDSSLTAPERLMRYWQRWQQRECEQNGCLVVKLSAEVADLSETMRLTLKQGCQQILTLIAQCIQQGQHDGSIVAKAPAAELAAYLYYSWLGSSLHYKLTQDKQCFIVTTHYSQQLLSQ